MALPQEQENALEKAGYRFAGPNRHAAVKICLWTKRSILNEGVCYKQKFYGINSHRCMQMSPAIPFCNHACLFCWRDNSVHRPKWVGKADGAKTILDECVEGQRALLTGFGGNAKADEKKFKEAQDPKHVAISLDGEPTLYPFLPELISEAHSREMTTFLVTNGGNPSMLKELRKKNALPTQLYVSVSAPDAASFKRVIVPLQATGWKNFNASLALLPSLDTRTTYRITLVRGLNDADFTGYAKLIEAGEPDFVEVKAYMAVGKSRERLGLGFMPLHNEIRERAEAIAEASCFVFVDEQKESRVCLLARDRKTAAKRKIKF